MLCVIAFHVSKTALSDFRCESLYSKTLFLSIRNIVHFVVPVFFMISGALILDPNKSLTIERLLKKYIFKYAVVILIFAWGYSFIEEAFIFNTINSSIFVQSFFNMLQGKSWAHMWYMYTLLEVMLTVPILRLVSRTINKFEIRYIIWVVLIFLCLPFIINAYTGISLGIKYPINCIYCFYMLIGYWINNEIIKISKKNCITVVLIVISFLVIFAYLQIAGIAITDPWVSNQSPLIIIYSICIFTIGKYYNGSIYRTPGIVNKLSRYSFSIYLIHMFWINLAYKIFGLTPFLPTPIVGFITVYLTIFLFSLISAMIMVKIPVFRRIL